MIPKLTEAQCLAIKCAHADLQGSMQAHYQGDSGYHDWDAHERTIAELENEFPFITEIPIPP